MMPMGKSRFSNLVFSFITCRCKVTIKDSIRVIDIKIKNIETQFYMLRTEVHNSRVKRGYNDDILNYI